MNAENTQAESRRTRDSYHFDRHTPEYREEFGSITKEMHAKCPLAWTDTYDGHWVAAGHREVFELARSPHVSNDRDYRNERRGYLGITIPFSETPMPMRNGILEMDDPEHRLFRSVLNPYLSPSAVSRWQPFVDELVRACLDDRIETGHIDFVDDLANIVPAVLTLAMMGIPLRKWAVYNEPAHASVYTPPHSPDRERVRGLELAMGMDLLATLQEIRRDPRPGLIDALARMEIGGETPEELDLLGILALLIGGGFDTTTALTAHALEWLSRHPAERATLSRERDVLLDSATEEFLRYFTPAPGDGRTIAADCEVAGRQLAEGERLWLSWAMANRDASVFPDPDTVVLDRKGNRHVSFGLGVHRCIGSNVARTVFKRMLIAVLDRMPDFSCDLEGAVHYDTIGIIQGMRKLPATFTPGPRSGPGLEETLGDLQRMVEEQRLAAPVATAP